MSTVMTGSTTTTDGPNETGQIRHVREVEDGSVLGVRVDVRAVEAVVEVLVERAAPRWSGIHARRAEFSAGEAERLGRSLIAAASAAREGRT